MSTKTCKICGESKDLEEFRKARNKWYRGECISCGRETARNYFKNNKDKINGNARLKRRLEPIWCLLKGAKNRSAAKKLKYDIDYGYLFEMWKDQNGCCALTGIPFILEIDHNYRRSPYRPSLDRIDVNKGYEKGNVRIVLWCINVALLNWGENVFALVANCVIEKQKNSSE